MNDIFITGIDTNIGKTITSAIFVNTYQYDYWKPIQAGNIDDTDTMTVKKLIFNDSSKVHPETYIFEKAISPHLAAKPEVIHLNKIIKPQVQTGLIIEGAGGVLVPINETDYIIDLIKHLDCGVVIVSKNYIGSINHTSLTIEALQHRNITIYGIVFNGDSNDDIENTILSKYKLKKLLHINEEKEINQKVIKKYSEQLYFNRQIL